VDEQSRRRWDGRSRDLFAVFASEFLSVSLTVLILNFILLLVVSILSFTRGRLYCNTICSVGTLLGLGSKFSLFKVKIDKNSCTQCGKCVAVCKAECIDLKTLKVDNSRCVACYNCLQVCPEDAAKYQFPKKKEVDYKTVRIDSSKRNFLLNSLAGSASLIAFSTSLKAISQLDTNNESLVADEKTVPVSPPGCVSTERLNELCTGYSLCIAACPTKVMRPAFLEYGLIGMMQPHLDFRKSFCEYDCIVCGNVCPTGAIKPLTKETKHLCQTGIAKFDLKKCIVETDHARCKDCFDHCPASAIRMIPYGDLAIPEIIENICNGCGECEFVCPARPSRAIFVVANLVHQLAKGISRP
jgi:ferredoxin